MIEDIKTKEELTEGDKILNGDPEKEPGLGGMMKFETQEEMMAFQKKQQKTMMEHYKKQDMVLEAPCPANVFFHWLSIAKSVTVLSKEKFDEHNAATRARQAAVDGQPEGGLGRAEGTPGGEALA